MKVQRFHTYELTFAGIAAAGNSTQNFAVETDYDFFLLKQQAFVYDANGLGVATTQWPLLHVTVSDGASSGQLMNQSAAIAGLFGTGQVPYILPMPHRIAGGATFSATVTNGHIATAYSVRLQFSGVHVSKGAGLEQQRRYRS